MNPLQFLQLLKTNFFSLLKVLELRFDLFHSGLSPFGKHVPDFPFVAFPIKLHHRSFLIRLTRYLTTRPLWGRKSQDEAGQAGRQAAAGWAGWGNKGKHIILGPWRTLLTTKVARTFNPRLSHHELEAETYWSRPPSCRKRLIPDC